MDSGFKGMTRMPSTDVYTDLNSLQNLKGQGDEATALRKVAEQFEAMFVNLLLKNMHSANDAFNEDGLFDSSESDFYRDMHDQQLALSLAQGRGFGIADALYRQLSEQRGLAIEANTERPVMQDRSAAYALQGLDGLLKEAGALRETASDAASASAIASRAAMADSPEDFVHRVKHSAEEAAQRIGVDKAMLIAQAALETGWGEHVYADEQGQSTHNLFNIKADARWSGERVERPTLEFLGGQLARTSASFRTYESVKQSFEDYSEFILGNERYRPAVEKANDAMAYIRNIHRAGYATDPEYSEKVASVYHRVKDILGEDRVGDADE